MSNRPKPTALKVIEGTTRADRVNKDEPKPPLVAIGTKAPDWIKDRHARTYWSELVPILSRAKMLALTDTTALALLAKAYGRWRQYEDFLEAHGETYETAPKTAPTPASDAAATKTTRRRTVTPATSGMLRPRPEVAMRDKAEDRLVRLLIEFGMTPSARTRVQALPELVDDPAEDFLSGRRGS